MLDLVINIIITIVFIFTVIDAFIPLKYAIGGLIVILVVKHIFKKKK